jgi:hypothetical protein
MTDTPQLAGADLARLALQNARAAAKTSPNPGPGRGRTKPKRTIRRGDGREPVTLAAALTGLGADLPLDDGVAGGSLLDQWPTLCPQYAGRVEPASYDPASGRLDLRPSSPAYAAQLRLLGGQLAKQINDKTGRPVVRTIRVLPVGHVPTQQPTTPTVPARQPDSPAKTRDTASPGYRAALEAALTHRPEHQPTDPYVLEAMQRQEAALRANRQPETEDREAHWAQTTTQRDPRPGSVEASLRAARAYKRREQAGLNPPRRAFDVA